MGKKVKISKVKRSQHLKHKKNFTKPLKKKEPGNASSKTTNQKAVSDKALLSTKKVFGKLSGTKTKQNKKQSKRTQNEQVDQTKKIPNNEKVESDNDNNNVDDILDMIDEEDRELFNGLQAAHSMKKRKRNENGDDELNQSAKQFEKQHASSAQAEANKRMRTVDLLPIKTKHGEIITRSAEVEIKENVEDEDEVEGDEDFGEEDSVADSDDDIVHDEDRKTFVQASKNAISTADLLILREQELNRQKYRIGIICSGILEKPDDKMKNFNVLFELMSEYIGDEPNLFSVRKIAAMSILEVFKDIIPEYRIGQIDLKTQTVKKTTMERVTYEDALLMHYKKFLQKLEKATSGMSKGQRRLPPEAIKMGEISVACLCELLLAHPYFNFSQNIAQLMVYLLNANYPKIRTKIHDCFQQLFKEDKKFDLSLFIVRRLNHLIKSKSNLVHVEVINCLMTLQIKSINLDAEKENELKQKKMEAHKARLINMSKKEKKRMKKLKVLEKELQETKAEENKQTKQYKLTEITKMVFTIFFRILKNDPSSSLLSATLEGLAEFAHTINIDFFSDLVEVLNNIMETTELGYREQLHCIQTVFTILSGQGEVLNIDPLRFYGHFYRNLLVCNAGKNHSDIVIILKTLNEVLVKRRKNISHHRLLAFIKRIVILSLQLLHNGTLACLGIVKTVMQLTSSLEIILDTDTSVGSGYYDPELDDPEYCNANCTALYELAALQRHCHPIVRKMASHIAAGVPASGEGSLAPEIGKLTALELYQQFDSSEMVFNPSIPPPKTIDLNKFLKGRHFFISDDVEEKCKKALEQVIPFNGKLLDFYSELRRERKN